MNQDLNTQATTYKISGGDSRLQRLTAWVSEHLSSQHIDIKTASADASFRRYFRASVSGESYIVMDAPPEKEDCQPFVRITQLLRDADVNSPRIHAQNIQEGFLLLDDFGDKTYLDHLNDDSADRLYGDAFEALIKIQQADSRSLPPYNHELLVLEMRRFPEWFLEKHLKLALSESQSGILEQAIDSLANVILEQPTCFVHRDYHSRNLMLLDEDNPGVIDYQDAVHGPITYDLLSLLRDAYITWPKPRIESWVSQFTHSAIERGIWQPGYATESLRWFDLMGIQRHLKVLGIFARLYLRDGKSGYLKDMPKTYEYLYEVSSRYTETRKLHALLKELDIGKWLA